MNSTIEHLSPCKKLLRIELDAGKVDSVHEGVAAEFRKYARIPGFRSGKAPMDRVARTYSKEILAEARKKLLQEGYENALKEHGLRPVVSPDVEVIQIDRGQPAQFTVTVETAPEFELPRYKGIQVTREQREVKDSDVDQAIDTLREQRASYVDVDRPAQSGDYVVVNYTGTSGGKPLTDIAPTARGLTQKENFWMHITPDSFVPGFTDQLVGAKAGEKRTVTVTFPEDFVAPDLANKEGVYEVEVVQVKEKVLPEANDQFAKGFEAEDMAALRVGVERDLHRELEYQQRVNLRRQVVAKLAQNSNFDLPESILAAETKQAVFDFVRENQKRGVGKEVFEEKKDEIYAHAQTNAKERLKLDFILARIAEQEKIKVSDADITAEIIRTAQTHGVDPGQYAKELSKREGGVVEVRNQALKAKTLDWIEQQVELVDAPAPAE